MQMQITCNNTTFDLKNPLIMGILNITPDSFYDGGKYKNEQDILDAVQKMLDEGALIIDIGAYSSRPNAKHISEKEELTRLIPIIKLLKTTFKNIVISVDTFRAKVAQKALEAGACIINDISAFSIDNALLDVVAKNNTPYVLMHMQGKPQNMQENPKYNDVVQDVKDFFAEKIALLHQKGIKNIILDVGFGFGKSIKHNYQLLNHLDEFKNFGLPMLVGISRKSMLYKPMSKQPLDMLNATTVANSIALGKGAQILRVHDVKEAREAIQIYGFLKESEL
jgi:dihydropteroate synthase